MYSNSDSYKEMVDILKAARKATGMSQDDFCQVSNMAPRSIGGYEAFDRCPTIDKLIKWADKLGYEVILRKKLL